MSMVIVCTFFLCSWPKYRNECIMNVQVSLLKWFDHFDFIWSSIAATRSYTLDACQPVPDPSMPPSMTIPSTKYTRAQNTVYSTTSQSKPYGPTVAHYSVCAINPITIKFITTGLLLRWSKTKQYYNEPLHCFNLIITLNLILFLLSPPFQLKH